MTATEIQYKLYTTLVNSSMAISPNVFIGSWECDMAQITKSGYLREFEIKLTRADFKADAKKAIQVYKGIDENRRTVYQRRTKYDQLQAGDRATEFYYVVPDGLIKAEELPEWAGLYYYKQSTFKDYAGYYTIRTLQLVKQAKRLNRRKADPKTVELVYRSCYYRFWQLWSANNRPKRNTKRSIINQQQLTLWKPLT